MKSRIQEAVCKKQSGLYNCAQSIVCTYCDLTNIKEEDMKNITHSFGAGMGNMEGTCGSLIGAGIIIGLLKKDKAQASKAMREMMARFKERNQSVVCKELKGIETKVVLRRCDDCVADAAEFLEDILKAHSEERS